MLWMVGKTAKVSLLCFVFGAMVVQQQRFLCVSPPHWIQPVFASHCPAAYTRVPSTVTPTQNLFHSECSVGKSIVSALQKIPPYRCVDMKLEDTQRVRQVLWNWTRNYFVSARGYAFSFASRSKLKSHGQTLIPAQRRAWDWECRESQWRCQRTTFNL